MFFLSISENILLFVSGFGILQAILLAALIYYHPKSDRSVTLFLALYIFCWCIPMFMPFVLYFSNWKNAIFLEAFPLLLGPLLYLYVCSFKEIITWRKAWPHFLLFFLFFVFDCWFYFAFAGKYPANDRLPAEVITNPVVRVRIGIRVFQMLFYFFHARKTLASYQKSIQHLFSETSRISLSWGKWLINGYLFYVLAIMAVYFLVVQYPQHFELIILINVAIVTPYFYMITYKGITQSTIWQIEPGTDKNKVEAKMMEAEKIEETKENGEANESVASGTADGKMDEIIAKINIAIEQDKLYREPELNLQNLADKIQFPSYRVSQAINEGMKKNFYDLVNGYRVEEAKRLLLDSKNRNYTILSVGFEAGFNSKTTFNTVFKKFTGLTPTEYRDKQKQLVSVA